MYTWMYLGLIGPTNHQYVGKQSTRTQTQGK